MISVDTAVSEGVLLNRKPLPNARCLAASVSHSVSYNSSRLCSVWGGTGEVTLDMCPVEDAGFLAN